MFRSLPALAVALGIAGLIPFIALGFGAIGANPDSALKSAQSLVAYGGAILAFLGGVHWGFTLNEPGDDPARRARLLLGVVPSLIGWIAISIALLSYAVLGLAILVAGFIATLVVEITAQKRDLLPGGYIALRWAMSVPVIAILTTVSVLRMVGAHVLL